MKTRFLAFLAAMAVGSAAVLIYASQSRQHQANASLGGAEECSACEMSAAKPTPAVAASTSAMDECCAADGVNSYMQVRDPAGHPELFGGASAALVADVKPAKPGVDACCAAEAAATTPVVATLDAAGCPYVAGDTTAALAAEVQPAKAAVSACCAEEAATPAVAAQVEKQ